MTPVDCSERPKRCKRIRGKCGETPILPRVRRSKLVLLLPFVGSCLPPSTSIHLFFSSDISNLAPVSIAFLLSFSPSSRPSVTSASFQFRFLDYSLPIQRGVLPLGSLLPVSDASSIRPFIHNPTPSIFRYRSQLPLLQSTSALLVWYCTWPTLVLLVLLPLHPAF